MTELDRFEARLAASLDRLAAEAPASVDARELAAAIAADEARRARWLPGLRGWAVPRAAVARVALVLLIAPFVAVGLLVLVNHDDGQPQGVATHGRLACGEPSLATGSTDQPLVLDCTGEVTDLPADGAIRMTLAPAVTATGTLVRTGVIELRSPGATWTGQVTLRTAPAGITVGDATLTGSGRAAGAALHLHLMSTDGSSWGVVGDLSAPAGIGTGRE